MIELKNVSKFYYSKGMIASGFSRVNLKFDVGEFVVITGESGSGKTTLLNVISGLDSYEEGELYIEGKETSHYLAADFEEYRKNYIGNISICSAIPNLCEPASAGTLQYRFQPFETGFAKYEQSRVLRRLCHTIEHSP